MFIIIINKLFYYLHSLLLTLLSFFFFFNDTATTEIYTLSLHDALPICLIACQRLASIRSRSGRGAGCGRSEEHTSELQSRRDLVCRLLLEKKHNIKPAGRLTRNNKTARSMRSSRWSV